MWHLSGCIHHPPPPTNIILRDLGIAFLNHNTSVLLTVGLPAVVHAFDVGVGGFFLAYVVIMLSWLFADCFDRYAGGGYVLGMATVGCLT